MTEIRALITSATLEMFVPYLEGTQAKLRADDDLIAAAVAAMPEYARPVVRPFWEFSPHISAEESNLDWAAIRAEFQRKAKKIGLAADHDVSFQHGTTGFNMQCRARGRS
jgi:hypothetical protein